jgi:hypothetical protein
MKAIWRIAVIAESDDTGRLAFWKGVQIGK